MPLTITEKVFATHVGKEVQAGEILVCPIDFAMAQDGTAPLAIQAFCALGAKKVFDPSKIIFVIDHNSPSPNEGVSRLHSLMRQFAREHGFRLYDIGQGVCHQLSIESGLLKPGDVAIGADSHTCTYGALNLLSTGVGSTDFAAAMMTGKLWFRVPETIRVELRGELKAGVYAKDLVLSLCGKVGSDGATYKSLEFGGPGLRSLSIDSRCTIANMAVEMGAKFGVFEADETLLRWLGQRGISVNGVVTPDPDASYERVIEIDMSSLEPMVALPHAVDNVRALSEVEGTEVNQGFIGTCTNGRLEDLEVAASMLRGRRVKEGFRLIIAPASREVLLKALDDGLIKAFIEAGAVVIPPGCGPCVGTHAGIPSDGERVISTANRNFKGRMGNPAAEIFLASPASVAAASLEGKIVDPRKVLA